MADTESTLSLHITPPRSLWLPILVGVFCRLLYLLLAPQREPLSDDAFYWATAQSLAAGEGYVYQGEPSTLWMPGFSLLLTPIVWLFGPSLFVARLFLLSLSVVTIPVLARLSARLFGEETERPVAFAAALFPSFWLYGTALLSETPSILFVSLCLLLAVKANEGFSWKTALALGLCQAALLYLKPEFSFLAILYVVFSLLRPQLLPRRAALVAACAAGVALAPWTYRNWLLFEEFIPLKSTGGKLIWWASFDPPLQAEAPERADVKEAMARLEVSGKPGKTSANYSREGIAKILEHPVSYLRDCVTVRARGLFLGSQTEASPTLSRSFSDLRLQREWFLLGTKLLLFAIQGLVSLLGIWCWFLRRHNRDVLWLPRLQLLANIGVYVTLLGITRYSMVLMPLLLPAAVVQGMWLYSSARRRFLLSK
jgi:4-amino-4-deoxy-L-arabinose transferase-like glycosyltransferase